MTQLAETATLCDLAPFGVTLEVSPDGRISAENWTAPLRRRDVRTAGGEQLGVIYGWLVEAYLDVKADILDDSIIVHDPVDDIESFEKLLVDGLHGVFAIVTEGRLGTRLYHDPGGQLPIVYEPATRRISSSANGILSRADYDRRLNRDRVERLVTREGAGWISGGLTAHDGIFRLLPNHYLDLSDFTMHRFWPRADFKRDLKPEQAAAIAGDALARCVTSAIRQYSTALTLTAGYDSRLLLCAARSAATETEFLTFVLRAKGLDADRAAEICADLGLQHRRLTIHEASPAVQECWTRMVGHSMDEVNRKNHPTLSHLKQDLLLTGMFGEMGRCRLFRHDFMTIDDEVATAAFVAARLTIPLDKDVLVAIEAWLSHVVHLPRSVVLELAFQELKVAIWGMGQAPAQKAVKMSLAPFAQRQIVDAFMRVVPAEKGTEALFDQLGLLLWPEAMVRPINRYGDMRDVMTKVRRLFDSQAVRRMARDRLAGTRWLK